MKRVEPDDYGPWSQTDLLLAAVVDGINVLAWQNSGGSKSSLPSPLPRPGVQRTTRRLTPEGRAYLENLRSQFREAGESSWAP